MGIPELTSYIKSISTRALYTEIKLENTKLVIDGSSLYHHLYSKEGFDCRCGGQYDEFYRIVLSFFGALNSNEVESYVVFDGADDPSDKKLETLNKRVSERIVASRALADDGVDCFLRPLLLKHVFLQALRNLGVKFAVCDSEADTEIASLARAWDCFVLSNDSDFFIFDIKKGYIPLEFFNWNSDHLTASVFNRNEMASHFNIRPELLPLLASLAGNDYVSKETLKPFNLALGIAGKDARFEIIAKMLSKLPDSNTEEEALEHVLQMVPSSANRDQLRQAVEHSLQEYSITESNVLCYFQDGVISSSLRTQNGHEIDEWLLRRFRDGYFSSTCMSALTVGKFLLGTLVENCREVSANRCSLGLRRFVYGILNDAATHEVEGNVTMVQEWDRDGLTIKPSNVEPYQEGVLPSVSLIPYLNTEERLTFLLSALDLDTKHIKDLPDKFKLIVGSLRFLLTPMCAQPMLETNHLLALLCCVVNLQQDLVEHRECDSQPFDVRAAQSFAQWQCVLRDAIQLNVTLLEPLPTPYIHETFNGKLAHTLREELDQGRKPEELVPSPGLGVFRRLYNTVTSDLSQWQKGKKTTKKKYRSTVRASNAALSTDVPLKNRFALLPDIGEQ